jgi:pimeloyl-ACP methyl ester carboxylesterase
VIPVLARTHRVLALSLPGHGDSAPAIGGYAPGADLAPLAADFLDTLGIGPLHLVGNSIGGAVVLRLALADPAREYLEHYNTTHRSLGQQPPTGRAPRRQPCSPR